MCETFGIETTESEVLVLRTSSIVMQPPTNGIIVDPNSSHSLGTLLNQNRFWTMMELGIRYYNMELISELSRSFQKKDNHLFLLIAFVYETTDSPPEAPVVTMPGLADGFNVYWENDKAVWVSADDLKQEIENPLEKTNKHLQKMLHFLSLFDVMENQVFLLSRVKKRFSDYFNQSMS